MRSVILVVDDQASMCWILSKLLGDAGFQVKTAQTATAALALAEKNEVQVAILDYRLPDMNGIELFQRMVARSPEVVGVLITSYGSEELKRSALSAGMAAYFDKPLANRKLVDVLKELLQE